jgi:hypothetical protein
VQQHANTPVHAYRAVHTCNADAADASCGRGVRTVKMPGPFSALKVYLLEYIFEDNAMVPFVYCGLVKL